MVEEDNYCIDIITQSLAVQSALKAVDEKILDNHFRTCVREAILSDHEVDTKIQEVIKTLNFMRK